VTTPERLRRRQRRESAFIAVLAVALCVVVFVYRSREAADDRCFDAFLQNQTETSKIRSELAERESRAERVVIRGAGKVSSREEFEALIGYYNSELAAIDKERKANPVKEFTRETCD
jgi:hypothetical protein